VWTRGKRDKQERGNEDDSRVRDGSGGGEGKASILGSPVFYDMTKTTGGSMKGKGSRVKKKGNLWSKRVRRVLSHSTNQIHDSEEGNWGTKSLTYRAKTKNNSGGKTGVRKGGKKSGRIGGLENPSTGLEGGKA